MATGAVFDWCQTEEYAAYFKPSFPNSRSYLQAKRRVRYDDTLGTKAYVEGLHVSPEPGAVGQSVQLVSNWTALAPEGSGELAFAETWEFFYGDYGSGRKFDGQSGTTGQGRFESQIEFEVPEDWPPGAYRVRYELDIAGAVDAKTIDLELVRDAV